MGDNPPCKVGMEKFRSGPEKFLEKILGNLYLSIMKSSYSTYSKSRKMGKKFNQRLRENEEVIKKVKGE